MLALETVVRIRIDHFRGKVPNKAIARKLGPWIGELERMLVERAVLPAALERLSRPGSCSATQIRKIGKAAPRPCPSALRTPALGEGWRVPPNPGSADDGISGPSSARRGTGSRKEAY